MKRRSFITYGLLFCLGIAIVACANEPETDRQPDTLRLAVTDMQGLEELQRNFEPFRKALETTTGKGIEFFPVSDRTAAAVALQSNQVDMVLTGPAEYVVIRARTKVTPLVGITRPNYRSVIAVRKESGIKDIQGLRGVTIAMAELGSTSGQLGPTQMLVDAGLDPNKDVKIAMLGKAAAQAFIAGDAQAWGVSALLYDRILESQGQNPADFPIIAEGPLLPNDLFVASNTLAADYVTALQDKMLQEQQVLIDAIVAVDSNKKYATSELIKVQDSDYESIRKAYRAIGITNLDPFEE